MATMLGSLLVSLGLESGEFKSGLDAAERQLKTSAKRIEKVGKNMSDLGKKLSIGVTAPLTALGVASFRAASDAAELESAFRQTFGSMSKDMEKWAVATGDAMGRSTQEIQNAANTFGIFFNQAAPTKQAAADMSKQFAVLAQDLSSFFNVDPTDAMEKLRSGLSGESEPLRAFGVFLNEAAVGQKALEMGLAKTTKELTDQNKIMARAALIMDATKNAQGDVIRTSDGTANKVRAAKAAFEELQVAIGQKLIPALTPLINGLTNMLNAFNSLPQGVQTGIVVFGALAAALGPPLLLVGSLTTKLAPLLAGMKAVHAAALTTGTATGYLTVSLAGLRAGLVALLTTGLTPWMLALTAAAGVIYLVYQRTSELDEANGQFKKGQDKANKSQEKATELSKKLAAARGEERKETLESIKIQKAKEQQNLRTARSDIAAARTALLLARAQHAQQSARQGFARGIGGMGMDGGGISSSIAGIPERQAKANLKAAEDAFHSIEATIKGYDEMLKAAGSGGVSIPSTGGGASSLGGSSAKSGASVADIEARFRDELESYRQQILSVRSRQAKSAQEAYDIEAMGIESARAQTLAQINSDADYTATQKKILSASLNRLADEELAAANFQKLSRWEAEQMDQMQIGFENRRDLLQNDYDLADTQAERKRVALDILALEQEYRRNQLEMVLASDIASEAEKDRAQAILDSLDAIQAGERAAANRANETEVERYMRDLNKSPAQINEALDRIKINGLESLNDALTDAIVNFKSLGSVVSSVVKSVLSDLLQLSIQQSIIKPIASALNFKIPGYASGTNFAPGGLALVGERGPELIDLPRGAKVHSNNATRSMFGNQGNVTQNFTINTPDADSFRKSQLQITREMRRTLNGK